ncbi:methylated-DNA-protein-cysteine methyltransferase [Bacillus sp. JCM 19046]|nr:methylated-DNA-protein-cysteine methyltransferase [Bacillus sp. JCM 19045]GAF18043.1 methylated-DNA-protein-cysteine methyltransferase [Bacillus sp. JCM 19046]
MMNRRYKHSIDSPVGLLTLTSDGMSITGLWNSGQKYDETPFLADVEINQQLPIFQEAELWLKSYFNGEKPERKLAVKPDGSDFRKKVWAYLLSIPHGETTTYGDIAKQLNTENGKPMSAQAVGGAVGHNPISIIIPCHRVVGASGSLTGYAGGIEVKKQLLQLENVNMETFFEPKS